MTKASEQPEEEWEGASAPDEIAELMDPNSPVAKDGDYWRGTYDPEGEERDALEMAALEKAGQEEEARWRAEEAARRTRPDWDAIGEALWRARNQLGISKREAARRAQLSEGAWRHLEAGQKIVNKTVVEPNPRNENLVSAARAVGLNPAELFKLACRDLPPGLVAATPDSEVIAAFRRLSRTDKALVEQLISRLDGN